MPGTCASARAARITRVIHGVRACLDTHAERCGDRVRAIAISSGDFEELEIGELWGMPVLAWEDVPTGQLRLLCDAVVMLVPEVDTVDELLDRWKFGLPEEKLPIEAAEPKPELAPSWLRDRR